MTLTCDDFPGNVAKFRRDDCVDNEFVHWCAQEDDNLVCLGARNLETQVRSDRDFEKKWIPEGFGRPEGKDRIVQFSVGSAGHMGFTDDEIPGQMRNTLESFSDEDMLEEVITDMKRNDL